MKAICCGFTLVYTNLQRVSFCVLIIASSGWGGGERRPTPFWCCPPVKYYWHDLWRRTAQNLPPDLAHFKKHKWGAGKWQLTIYLFCEAWGGVVTEWWLPSRSSWLNWSSSYHHGGLAMPHTYHHSLPHTTLRSPLCHLECCWWWGGGGGEIFCFLSTPSYHSEWQLRPLCQLEHCAHN